jgi:hypothetical protein
MWRSLFDDPETRVSFERLRNRFDERMAFMVAATDGAFRNRVKTGYSRPDAFAKTMGELAVLNATLEGYSPDEATERERLAYDRAVREGLDDPEHPLAVQLFPLGRCSLMRQQPDPGPLPRGVSHVCHVESPTAIVTH